MQKTTDIIDGYTDDDDAKLTSFWNEILEREPFKTQEDALEDLRENIERLDKRIDNMGNLYNLGQKMDIIIEHLRIKNKFQK